jgi:hypothetical protein
MLHPRPGAAMRASKKYGLIMMHKITMEIIPHKKAQMICAILNHCLIAAPQAARITIALVKSEMSLYP